MQAMPTRIFLILFILILICPPALQAAAERRTALVIGNSAYSSGPLKNPVNDAADVATALKRAGFSVTLKKDASFREMMEAIEEFGNILKKGGVGLFYFAGHGVQVSGVNYLLPIGARINKEGDVRYEAVDAGRILAEMENANNGFNIVLLDACRDNPFGKSFRSASRGLAIVTNAPTGTFISYSTGAGQVARDGTGKNSPYTSAVLQYMQEPGVSITDVFIKVRQKLRKETGQVPWELSSLEGNFFFIPGLQKVTLEQFDASKDSSASNRQNINKTRQRIMTGEDSQQATYFALAKQAYNEKKFAEPQGENTIEYLRKILIDDPDNSAALDLEKRAIAAYENEAKFALSRKNEKRSLEIYQRLFSLYPEKKQYLDEFVKLETTKLCDISGNWHPEHVSGKAVIYSDGRCIYKGFLVISVGGKWSCIDPHKRKFSIVWNHGYTDVMTLSADGQKLEGVNDSGDPVSFVRDK
jgi:hypothetical protein